MLAAALAFVAEGLGVAIGMALFYLFRIKNKRLIGMLFGSTSGLMIAMVCFNMLPEAFSVKNDLFVFVGIAIGVCFGLSLAQVTEFLNSKMHISGGKNMQAGLALLIGIAIHGIPEGFALGSFSNASRETLMNFALIICLHSIPEAIALAISFKQAQATTSFLISVPIVLGGIMSIGAVLGYLLSQVSTAFIAISLGMAAGIILYVVCEELLPESRHIWNGRMTTLATILGIILGMLLVSSH